MRYDGIFLVPVCMDASAPSVDLWWCGGDLLCDFLLAYPRFHSGLDSVCVRG